MSASTINMEAIKRLRAISDLIESAGQEIKMGPSLLLLLDVVKEAETALASRPTEGISKKIIESLEAAIDLANKEICLDCDIVDLSIFWKNKNNI
ncbi:hypothetical protein [Methylobacterium tarhaniae]|uniref:hypothetical protein n=1 Tax=Methylobacterium tarhaniae TaxID=1187852 RepID=UPI0012ECF617|nr:hypothetical protein [Methylobacterium tarhaniae]